MSCVLPVLGSQCFENLKIIPFLAMSTRKYSDVVSDHQEEACSAGDTHSWLTNYQQENEEDLCTSMSHQSTVSKAQSIWEQVPKKCAMMVIRLLSFFFLANPKSEVDLCKSTSFLQLAIWAS